MAKDGKKFNKKLALTITIPALIMVVIMGVVGVSFAWFTDSVTAEIATINLSVAEVFVMEFVLSQDTQINTTSQQPYIYSGQIGYDYATGMLITNPDDNDKAFVAPFDLRLDTGGYSVSFNCSIVAVNIDNNSGADNPQAIKIDEDSTGLTIADIPLGFTWYISGDNKWYTPYGTLNLVSGQGVPGNESLPGADQFGKFLPAKVSNSGFVAKANADDPNSYNYTFNIVFAPELLYWQQYCVGDPVSATELYGYSNVDGGFKSPKWNALNKYSSQVYSGYTYKFVVLLEVETATKLPEGNG